jgi:hypothetical protein
VDTDLGAQFDKTSDKQKAPTDGVTAAPVIDQRRRSWANWTFALLTVPGAAMVVVLWFDAVMGLAGCSDVPCRHEGPGEFLFTVLVYGAPVVAVITVAISCFTARRQRGFFVPVLGWTLLAADVVVLAVSFRP